ncbi:MAG: xanthine dehydrogenase molybdopterin binding subunit [Vicinamibacterales bacterium]
MNAERQAVGRAVSHESADAHVSGRALYSDDLSVRFPNLLHAWPVTAPHAHARLTRLDVAPALSLPGVVSVLTTADVPGHGRIGPVKADEPLFPQEVQFYGHPVAWVLADTLHEARRGAAAVVAEYEPLPAVLSIREAIAAGSYLTDELRIASGSAPAPAPGHVHIEGELEIGGQEHFYLETHASIAWLDAAGGVTVASSTQHPAETQASVAHVLGVPQHQVSVECLRMGGAFGGKEWQASTFAAIAAVGAWKTKRPVRVRLPRELDMMLSGKRHPYLARFEATVDAEGLIQHVRIALWSDGGWSLDLSEAVMYRSLFHVDNAYHVPSLDVTGRVCRTHKTSQTAFRGFGGPQGVLVIEDILARAALRLGLAPDEIRARNLYREGDRTHYGQLVGEAHRMRTLWDLLREQSGFDERRAACARFNETSPHTKRGLAITPVKFGISFTASFFNQAGAFVVLYRDGSVQVNHGGTEMGQGLATKIRQIAADVLGAPLEAVRVMPARTDIVPNASATAASSGTDLNGAAVVDACAQLRGRLTSVASPILGCELHDVHIQHGEVRGPGEARLTFADVCEAAYRRRVPLFANGFYRTPGLSFDRASGRGTPFHYFTYGAAVVEVELDGFTGDHRVRRVDILQDVGDSISPLIDRGQVEGGFIQGLGWLTIEELVWDSAGRLRTDGAATYKIPSWSEVPDVFNVRFLPRASQQGVVMGSKAVGEPPLLLAIAAREALRDVLCAFGVAADRLDSPLTAERLFGALRR